MKCFSLIYQGDVHFASEKKVIPSEDFSLILSAKELVEKAKEDAVSYVAKAEQECEEIKKNAEEEGFSEGLSKFNDHILQFEIELRKIRHEAQKSILPIALKAAKKIVAKELELHPETIVDIVIQAIAPIKQNHKIKIYVNKEDKESLESNKAKLKSNFEQLHSLSILERSDVTKGGCIIETESGIINASIENQWRALESAFEKYMKP
ncbi:MAG: HrpE/YscL family type III secretion apparatus protein [Chlamydiae bacterium]|nr:HrpE/YscL family type III secretion apparatus protein [Chlamydiota bacterium]